MGERNISRLCVSVTGGWVQCWKRAFISLHFVLLCPDVPSLKGCISDGTVDCGSQPLQSTWWCKLDAFGIYPRVYYTKPIGDPNELLTILYTAAVTDDSEEPNFNTAESWHAQQDPLWRLFPRPYIDQTRGTLKHPFTEHKRTLGSGEAVQSAVTKNMEEAHTIKWEDEVWWTTIRGIIRDAPF